jgi:Protein of unknown function (DUF2934)
MPARDRDEDQAVRETAYMLWEREGRPEGRAREHWARAMAVGPGRAHDRNDEPLDDEEKVLAGRIDANMPALLTKDVPGG